MNKILSVTPIILAFALVSASCAPKVFAHTAAYDVGWKSGLLDRGNGFHRNAENVCNQDNMEGSDGTNCIQGYNDAFKIKQTAYWQGYEMGLQDLKNQIHQQGVDVCNQADIEGKPELQCIQAYNDAFR